jgi:hypothetical protein
VVTFNRRDFLRLHRQSVHRARRHHRLH